MQMDFGGGDDVSFAKEGHVGLIRLTREKALNALNFSMINALNNALIAWEKDDDVACVIVEGEGRAFCAGGDVVAAYKAGQSGQPLYSYFESEYKMNYRIGNFQKPFISFLNGIVMGGGVGLSIHGSHRIITEKTVFAMPESAIGFFPDVGTSAVLPGLPNQFGLYLALTGEKIKQGDCLQFGLATHALHESDLAAFKQELINSGNPRPFLEANAVELDFDTPIETRNMINECFCAENIDEIFEKLQQKAESGNEFAKNCLATLQKRSPTSLKVIYRQFSACKPLSLGDCLIIDNRIAKHMLDGHDFYEGVRAVLVDKDGSSKWQPSKLADVTNEQVEAYFSPLDKELSF
ncbi:enoyl-CoA hydratase/isomerase family protein [Bartonella sp. HY761]|uniref:enoyl-CoA hydratase/isomerase family protein n=1 Tax=Bartonella sp. HY761 TaxID=2979330 RepID=UPI00220CF52B|nr:enoyl-CoA hydratase/isomerase family protein [Bartonella sp. HY761]UXN07581.1 enoyl-CoA hydratase/isomerase family protein [Bartonella sp. HY761]